MRRSRRDRHLALCGSCLTYVGQMRETISRLGELAPDELSPQLQADLTAAFRDWKDGG